MPKKGEKNKTMGYFLGEQISSPIILEEEEQCLPSGKDTKVKASVSQTSKINIQWAQAMKELKKDSENQPPVLAWRNWRPTACGEETAKVLGTKISFCSQTSLIVPLGRN